MLKWLQRKPTATSALRDPVADPLALSFPIHPAMATHPMVIRGGHALEIVDGSLPRTAAGA